MAMATWEKLPEELKGKAIGNLGFADRLRFSAVCKDDLEKHPVIEEAPWLLSFSDMKKPNSSSIKLLDPSRKNNYVVHEFNEEEKRLFRGNLGGCRFGWVMINNGRNVEDAEVYVYSTKLFNPFTREAIELPDLEIDRPPADTFKWCNPLSSLYVDAKSPNCLALAIWRGTDSISIATCSPDDASWMIDRLNCENFVPYGISCFGEAFYCVSTNLDVGVFRVQNRKWEMFNPKVKPEFCDQSKEALLYGAVVGSDSKLLWYECVSEKNHGISPTEIEPSVWRFDVSDDVWVKEKLSNFSIFTSQASSFSVEAKSKLGGMIYHGDKFFSLGGGRVGSDVDDWSRFYDWMRDANESKVARNMWIDPRPIWKKSQLIQRSETPVDLSFLRSLLF